MLSVSDQFRRQAAEWMARPMFCLAMVFLILLAILLLLWGNVPLFLSMREEMEATASKGLSHQEVMVWISPEEAAETGKACLLMLAFIWPFFWLELLFQFLIRDRSRPFWRVRYQSLLVCLFPPFRMCAHNYDMEGKIWFPSLGWRTVDNELREQLEKAFSVPMVFIALAILPVLLVELGMREQVLTRPWLQFLLHASTGIIWFAFAAEFIVMVSVADNKLRYCKEHWIDLAIILLPFISFLRSLRAVRALRLARMAKVQQLSKMGRIYRLRGLMMRAVRALMILELFSWIFRIGPEKRLRKLRDVLEEKEREVASLREEVARLERLVEQQQEADQDGGRG